MHYSATYNKIKKIPKDDQNRQVSIFEKSPKMCDIFNRKEARKVLANKHIAVIGGSNMRGLYKVGLDLGYEKNIFDVSKKNPLFFLFEVQKWYFVTKIVLTYCEKCYFVTKI